MDELVRTYSDWVMLVIRLYHETQVTVHHWWFAFKIIRRMLFKMGNIFAFKIGNLFAF